MKNFKHKGGVLTLDAPRNLLAGDPFIVGTIFAIATASAASGSPVESKTRGVFSLPKTAGQAWISGQRIYWDDTNRRCDTASAAGVLIGVAVADVAAGGASGAACLSGACLVLGGGSAPAVMGAAAITGLPQQGVPLSITSATFSGTPTPTVTRVIRMDGTQVASGNQSTTYSPVAGDVGKIPSVTDTATNGVGSPATSTGAGSAVIAAAGGNVAPSVATGVAITGAPQQGVQLAITPATFNGTPAPTVTRVIKIAGVVVASGPQNSTNYTPVLADVGKIPTVEATASNGVGSPAVSTATGSAILAAGSFKNTGTMRLVGTQAQVTAPSVVTFAGGMASRIVKIQAPSAAIGCRISVHNLSPVMGVNYVKASVAPTDIAAVDTLANAYNAYANGVTHNVTASGADPLGFTKATWGGAAQSRRLEPSDAVLPSFGYNNQQDTVTSDPIMGLVPKRATDRANEEYYYLVRLTIGLVQNYDGLCVPVAGAVTGPNADYAATNGADSVLWHGGDLGLVDGVDGAYTIPAAIAAQQMPVMSVEWIYPPTTPAITFVHPGDSVTEGYSWPRIAVNRKSTVARPMHHVNLGGSTTRTGSFLGNMYLYLQSNAKPDYMVMPIISINNYSPLSDFTLAAAQAEYTRLQEVEAFLTGLGIKIIWWTPFNFGANPASSDVTSAWGYLYNNAKAYATTKNITFMDINGDARMVRSVYNASTNPTGWIAPDNTHPSNPAGIQGFAAVYGDQLTALGY